MLGSVLATIICSGVMTHCGTYAFSGLVLDPGGHAVPGARVELAARRASRARLTTWTNRDGAFVFANVDPRLKALKVGAAGNGDWISHRNLTTPNESYELTVELTRLRQVYDAGTHLSR